MQITVVETATKVVTETVEQQIQLPYFGRNAQATAMVAIRPVMWPHVPDQIQYLAVLEVKSAAATGSAVKETRLAVPAAHPVVPVQVLAYLSKYPVGASEPETGAFLDKTIGRLRGAN